MRRVTVEIDLEVGRPPGAGEPLVVGSGGGAEEEEGTVCLFFAVVSTFLATDIYPFLFSI